MPHLDAHLRGHKDNDDTWTQAIKDRGKKGGCNFSRYGSNNVKMKFCKIIYFFVSLFLKKIYLCKVH